MEYLFLFMTLLGYWVGIINIEKLWKGTRDSYLPTAEELIVVDDNGTGMFNSGKYNYTDIRKSPSFSENDSSSRINEDRATLKIIEGNLSAVSYPIHVSSHERTVIIIK